MVPSDGAQVPSKLAVTTSDILEQLPERSAGRRRRLLQFRKPLSVPLPLLSRLRLLLWPLLARLILAPICLVPLLVRRRKLEFINRNSYSGVSIPIYTELY